MRAWRLDSHSAIPYVIFGIVILLILGLAWMWDSAAQQRAARYATGEDSAEEAAAGEVVYGATDFPVPPLDLPHYHGVGLGDEPGLSDISNKDTSSREVTGA